MSEQVNITLRLSKEVNELIEKEVKKIGISKNKFIVEACKELVNNSLKKTN